MCSAFRSPVLGAGCLRSGFSPVTILQNRMQTGEKKILLSDKARQEEKVKREAEDAKQEAEDAKQEAEKIKRESQQEIERLKKLLASHGVPEE